jgi:hypothetical protein
VKTPPGGPRDPVRLLPTRATRLIAICGKCGRKVGGGFGPGGDKSLAKTLRRAANGARGKRATLRIVETRCLDICPKRAVALIDSESPGRVMIVPEGVRTDAVIARLGLTSTGLAVDAA